MYDCFVFHTRTQEEADAFRELFMNDLCAALVTVCHPDGPLAYIPQRKGKRHETFMKYN